MSWLAKEQDKLRTAWKALQAQWKASCALWNDPVQRDFQEGYWSEYEQIIPQAQKALASLSDTIATARRTVR